MTYLLNCHMSPNLHWDIKKPFGLLLRITRDFVWDNQDNKVLNFTTTCQFVIKFVSSRPFLSNSTGLYLFVDKIYIYVIYWYNSIHEYSCYSTVRFCILLIFDLHVCLFATACPACWGLPGSWFWLDCLSAILTSSSIQSLCHRLRKTTWYQCIN